MIVANDATAKGGLSSRDDQEAPARPGHRLREPPAVRLPRRLRRGDPVAATRCSPTGTTSADFYRQADVGARHPADRRRVRRVHGGRGLRPRDRRRVLIVGNRARSSSAGRARQGRDRRDRRPRHPGRGDEMHASRASRTTSPATRRTPLDRAAPSSPHLNAQGCAGRCARRALPSYDPQRSTASSRAIRGPLRRARGDRPAGRRQRVPRVQAALRDHAGVRLRPHRRIRSASSPTTACCSPSPR